METTVRNRKGPVEIPASFIRVEVPFKALIFIADKLGGYVWVETSESKTYVVVHRKQNNLVKEGMKRFRLSKIA